MNNPPVIRMLAAARGFTLIELMVTITIAAILLGIAAPSFRDLAIRNELSTYANALIASINYARSEAVRRGKPVVICPSDDDGASCSGTWNDGWITFADLDDNGELDTDKDESVLKTQRAVSPGYSIDDGGVFDGGITYKSDGSTESTGIVVICNQGKVAGARAVVITPLRPRVATDTDNDGIPNDDENKNIAECESAT